MQRLGARGDGRNPEWLTPGIRLQGHFGAPRATPTDPGKGARCVGTGEQGGQIQARRGSHILTLQDHVLNFTFPFIYFFFLNPVSLPEAPNLLFNIGLYD